MTVRAWFGLLVLFGLGVAAASSSNILGNCDWFADLGLAFVGIPILALLLLAAFWP